MSEAQTPTVSEITQFELLVEETNQIPITPGALEEITAILKPIANAISPATAFANTCVVVTQAEADAASAEREKILANHKQAIEAIEGFDNKLISRLFQLHRKWTGFRNLFEPLESAARKIKSKLITYNNEQERLAELDRQRLQAEADEQARKDRQKLEKRADNLKTPEKAEAAREQAQQVTAPVVRVEAPRASIRVSKRWAVAKIDNKAFFEAVAKDPSLQGYVNIDLTKLARGKSANTLLEIAGVTFEQKSV